MLFSYFLYKLIILILRVRLFLTFFQETYYVPYKKIFNKKLNAKGKLYDKYTNYLRTLRTHGLASVSTITTETQSIPGIFLLPILLNTQSIIII